ncbi:S8 family serine peptidase [Phyllobacterium bourgognense]|uniref:Subtilase family protein n=1 Tax=Phyllobacterium bourgognense TaxID=314236 RepID=A0A368YU47_9HYPH|nr:S8 family serine peptidase [Phyllobacterium bourgognense]RCW83740.1 subtilase family protein [Phyllobacterium bourgognense]
MALLQSDNTKPAPVGYYYLWHLAALGVITADFGSSSSPIPSNNESALRATPSPVISGSVWDTIANLAAVSPARVALIDVGISPDHPNLTTRIDQTASIDLATHKYGARALDILDDTDSTYKEEKEAFFAELDISGLGNLGLSVDDKEYLDDIVAEYAASYGVLRRILDSSTMFAAHGTACAGLIVAEPAALPSEGGTNPSPPEDIFTNTDSTETHPNKNPNLLPYFGADPFSRLVNITTSFEENAVQFIAAFLYAYSQNVDVIVMPRGIPDPKRSAIEPKNELKADLERWANRDAADLFARIALAEQGPVELEPRATQLGSNPDRMWNILKQLIIGVSRKIPVICAAGNSGESQLIYPASLAAPDNGIIAVGAVTAEGFRSGYSNYGEGLTLVAPSDDGEVFNRHQLRINRLSPLIAKHQYSPDTGKEYCYSHLSLLSTDLPGVFGYDEGKAPWSTLLPSANNPGVGGGYYTSFGGTSGAAALVGGVAALVQRAHRAVHGGSGKLDGIAVKSILEEASSRSSDVGPGIRPLTPDCMNGDHEDVIDPRYFFGAGLLNAAKAVGAVLNS